MAITDELDALRFDGNRCKELAVKLNFKVKKIFSSFALCSLRGVKLFQRTIGNLIGKFSWKLAEKFLNRLGRASPNSDFTVLGAWM